jgi:hypothetical protein
LELVRRHGRPVRVHVLPAAGEFNVAVARDVALQSEDKFDDAYRQREDDVEASEGENAEVEAARDRAVAAEEPVRISTVAVESPDDPR